MIEPKQAAHPFRKHEAHWAQDIFDRGIGWIVAARFKSAGRRVEAGVFCVDVWCLGVKRAFLDDTIFEDYQSRILGYYASEYPMAPIAPCCARKFIEGAVQYAARLGFAPHHDCKKASRVFGGIKAGKCTQDFTYGKDGKPFYMRGPSENEERSLQIIRQLHQRCGEGNFHYLAALGAVEDLNRFYGD